MLNKNNFQLGIATFAITVGALFVIPSVSANRFESPSYIIDASVANNFGGTTEGGSYKMVSSGGEAVIGNGEGGSYKLGVGYVAQLAESGVATESISLNVQPTDVVAYYSLDEGVGTVAGDGSVNAYDGTLTNSPVWGTTGKIGGNLQFDGVNQYVTVANQTSMDIGPGQAKTISVWFKAGAQAANGKLLWKDANCLGWDFELMTTGVVGIHMNTGNNGCTGPVYHWLDSNNITAGTRYDDNLWHHVAAVIDRSNGVMLLYIDGIKKGEGIVNTTDGGSGGGDFRMATNWDNTTPYAGALDEVKIFNRALTVKELVREYETQNSGSASAAFLSALTPGISQNVSINAVVKTDASGYNIAVSQNGDLTKGVDTISAVSSTIASPQAWSEGTTKGLGFTLTGGLSLPAKWGADPNYNYAALPNTSTTFRSRSGYVPPVREATTIQYRVDAPVTQPMGDYVNTVTYTATMLP